MLFFAVNSHQTLDCPRERSDGKKMLNRIFSRENAKRLGVRVIQAYTSCPKSTGEDHKVFFIIDTTNADTVRRFFSPMIVDVRQITPFSEAITK